MAIESVKLLSTSGGGFQLTSESWSAKYRICLDNESCNCSDVRSVIVRAWQFGGGPHALPFLGDFWPPALPPECDNLTSLAYVKSVVPDGDFYQRDQKCCIDVVVNYEFDPQGGDSDTDNPLDVFDTCPRVDMYTQTELEEVENAIFKGAWQEVVQPDPQNPDPDINLCANRCVDVEVDLKPIDNECYQRALDTCGPVVNVVGNPFNPPLEREFTLHGFRITYFLPFYDEFNAYRCFENTSNCEDFEIIIPCRNFYVKVLKDTGYLRSVTGQPGEFNSIDPITGVSSIIKFWEVTYDVLIDQRGWCRDLLNKGVQRAACDNDPDGFGGTYSTGSNDGEPALAAILNREGHEITDEMRLNLEGQPMDPNEGSWFLRYGPDGCTDFTDPTLGLGATPIPEP